MPGTGVSLRHRLAGCSKSPPASFSPRKHPQRSPEATPPVLPSAAALLDGLFEHPAGRFSSYNRRAGNRSSAVLKGFFRSLLTSQAKVRFYKFSYPSTRHSTTEPCLPAAVAKCGSGRIRVEAFVSRIETGPGPHICFFHAGKPMLDQQEILDMASPKSSGMSIAVHRPVQHTP